MATNLGKAFENQFRQDTKDLPNCFVFRLPDQQSGYVGTSANPCDFLMFKPPHFFLLELKSITGNTFPFSNLRQYGKLRSLKSFNFFHKGVIIWFRDHDKIIYVTIDEITKMMGDGKKSVNINTIDDDGYNYITIPTIKKRIFLSGDYSVLFNDDELYNKGDK